MLPYLILARDALIVRDFKVGLKLSKVAYAHATNDRAQAQAMEFIAISYYELGRPLDVVLDRFDRAHQLDPSNDVILQNRAAVVRDAQEKSDCSNSSTDVTKKHQNFASNLTLAVEEEALSEGIINYIDNLPRFEKPNQKELDKEIQSKYALAV